MESYAKVLSLAIPFFIVLILIEEYVGRRMGRSVNRGMDTIASLSSGMTNTLKEMLGLSVVIFSYQYMVDAVGIFDIKSSIFLYIAAFIGIDFAGYWSHRFNHEINLFWNRHIIHHSSEEFNLACALRQSISDTFGIYFFLYLPLAFVGVPFKIIAVVAPLHLFAQFWYHTRLIEKMGFLENFMVTPSHHRVHHAINNKYLDKNYGQIFIFWDKWFGTFQKELPQEKAVFGIKKPAQTWNPILINYQHLWQLLKDGFRTVSWKDKLTLWFRRTGYRPADVQKQYPVTITERAEEQIKYDTPSSKTFLFWSWLQLAIHNLMLFHLLNAVGDLSTSQLITYGIFLFFSISSYTSLMDRSLLAIPAELIKLALGIYILLMMNNWFNIDNYIPYLATFIAIYLGMSLLLSLYFIKAEALEKQTVKLKLT